MRRIVFILIAVLVLFGCNKREQFTVTLNIENADHMQVSLLKEVEGKRVRLDSTVFVGKKAELKADFDAPQTCYIIQFDHQKKCDNIGCENNVFLFFTENQNTTITGDFNARQNWMVNGCPTMEDYNTFRRILLPKEDSIMAIYSELSVIDDTIMSAELDSLFNAALEEYNNTIVDFIRSHPGSYFAHLILDQQKESFDFETVKELSETLTNESDFSRNVKEYVKQNQNLGLEQSEAQE